MNATQRKKVLLYGCGVVAPGSRNISEFVKNLKEKESLLEDSEYHNHYFKVGMPQIDFARCADWIKAHCGTQRYQQLRDKGGANVQMSIISCLEAIEMNPGLLPAIKDLGPKVAVITGSCFGDFPSQKEGIHNFKKASFVWNSFWATPENNSELRTYLQNPTGSPHNPPEDFSKFQEDTLERIEAKMKWDAYWTDHSPLLKELIKELTEVESQGVGENVAQDKLSLMRQKMRQKTVIFRKYGCPSPPWESVKPDLLWNIPNTPASQITMLLGTTGTHFGISAACATFPLGLEQADSIIQSGQADLVILNVVDSPPTPEVVAAFSSAKVLAQGLNVSHPLTKMRGTHVSGGAATWILGTSEAMEAYGLNHMGIEILGTGCSSDAEHIITPSFEGPKLALSRAFRTAKVTPQQVGIWDMHATGTPGDWSELTLIEDFVGPQASILARKGQLGHGMSVAGAWETMASLFTLQKKQGKFVSHPMPVPDSDIHPAIKKFKRKIDTQGGQEIYQHEGQIYFGKLSMGIGGISASVVLKVDPQKMLDFLPL